MKTIISSLIIITLLTGFIFQNNKKEMSTKKTKKMKVEIWSDVMCPFCYIGKRRFEKALANFEHKNDVEIIWRSFQLNPYAVTNPDVSVIEDLAQKKGWTIEQTMEITKHVTEMASDEGLDYHFDKAVSANSFNAHRLLQFAKTQGKGDELKEKLLAAYFIEGKNTDDSQTLIDLGIAVDLDKNELTKVVNDKQAFAEQVNADIQKARDLKINGVPYFLMNGEEGVSGAQSSKTFEKSLEKAYKEWTKQ